MKVYDKIKSMNQTEMAQFISDLLCGNFNEPTEDLIISFNEDLCINCRAGIIKSDIGTSECDYANGNCSDVSRIEEWLESEVEEYV